MYPSCSKRMLRTVDTEPEMTSLLRAAPVVPYGTQHSEHGWYRSWEVLLIIATLTTLTIPLLT